MTAVLADSSRRNANAMLTAGLKCAPDTGPNHGENSAGRKRVAEKRQRAVTAREFCGHDA
jgi:hypothetical protein